MNMIKDPNEIAECMICKVETEPFMEKDGYHFQKCSLCGLVFVFPQPQKEMIVGKLYSEGSGYQGNKSKDLSNTEPTVNQKKVLNWLATRKKGKLLDIGCSNGEFMWLAKKAGFDTSGVELNKRTADIARNNGLDVFCGTLDEGAFPSGSFDYIYMGDLIEHVSDPLATLSEAKRLLRPGGTIIIVTPNLDCFWSMATFRLYEWFGIPWASLTPPYHLFQFSRYNLNKMLAGNGFTMVANLFGSQLRLRYELGSLHLLKRFKARKDSRSFLFMVMVFALYAILYAIDRATRPFHRTDVSVIGVYRK